MLLGYAASPCSSLFTLLDLGVTPVKTANCWFDIKSCTQFTQALAVCDNLSVLQQLAIDILTTCNAAGPRSLGLSNVHTVWFHRFDLV